MTEDESLPPLARRLVLGFMATLFLYITVYGGCQAMRRRGGPWAVTFAETNGVPMLEIRHHRILGTEPVRLLFPGEKPNRTDLPITAVFSQPITNAMPFGPVIFVDTTILPGTLTLNAFGHVVEMVPRTLFVNFEEKPWQAGLSLTLSATNKPPADKLQPPRRSRR